MGGHCGATNIKQIVFDLLIFVPGSFVLTVMKRKWNTTGASRETGTA